MRIGVIIMGLLCIQTAFSQDLVGDRAEAYYANQEYEELIELLGPDAKKYSARANYFIGMAYYMLADDENCIKHMEYAISEDKNYAGAYFMKGTSHNYGGEYEEAIDDFEDAIALDTTVAEYYSGLGDSYFFQSETELALSAYESATALKNCPERPYIMIPMIHLEEGKTDQALLEFYTAKSLMTIGTVNYTAALYNIGLIEFQDSNYTEAENALSELLMINSADFEGYIALIQVYHAQGKYDKTSTLSEQIRKAYDWEMLPESIGSQYVLEQFNWDTLSVIAYERLPQPTDELYYKYQFKVFHEGEFQYSIQLQRNLGDEDPERKYVLGIDRYGRNSSFNGWYTEDATYATVREAMLSLLEDL